MALFEKLDGDVRCKVCFRECRIAEGKAGLCKNYKNEGGELRPIAYGIISSIQKRPIEIKPLFHYWPGSWALTFSGYGCNLYCPWCQNFDLSFALKQEGPYVSPDEMLLIAEREKVQGFSASFNEPVIHFDYLLDVFRLAKKKGFYSMMVTNGTFTSEALRKLIEAGADGFSIDVKGCPGERQYLKYYDPEYVVKRAEEAVKLGAHVELVYLVVPKFNDSNECIEWFLDIVEDRLGPDTPIHFNRYFPAYRYSEPPTPIYVLFKARATARRKGFRYVYLGNLGDPNVENTYCPGCDMALIFRSGGSFLGSKLEDGKCPRCGYKIPIKGKVLE